MKRLLFILLVSILLTACSSSKAELSISEIENVPDDIQKSIDSKHTLQLINVGEKPSYVVYQSNGEVTPDLEKQGDTLHIMLHVTNEKKKEAVVQHVYKLNVDDKLDTIKAFINGESTSFAVVILGDS